MNVVLSAGVVVVGLVVVVAFVVVVGFVVTFVADSNVVRVAGIEASYIYNKNRNKGTDGIFIPANIVEYFKVEVGDEVVLISGKVNVSSVY